MITTKKYFENKSIMITHNITNIDELLKKLGEIKKSGNCICVEKIYRGIPDIKYDLKSTAERFFKKNDKNDKNDKDETDITSYKFQIDDVISKFKNNIKMLSSEYENISEEDAWILGRHFGLISPYLDWSKSYFKALFFACNEYYKNPKLLRNKEKPSIAIYKLSIDDSIQPIKKESNNFEILRLNKRIGTRMYSQSYCFTKINTNHDNVDDYLKSINKSDLLDKYIIPGNLINDIIVYLNEIEINNFTMYPDLEGAAIDANISFMYNHALKLKLI